jgi:hypothetical protein
MPTRTSDIPPRHFLPSAWAPLLWGVGAFLLYFYYAQFIPGINWNAIELIIAQHIIEHGTYATSIDYPSALTWRPVFSTLTVTFFRLWTDNPILIYQIICAASLGTLTVTLFLSARILWGGIAGHFAAFCTAACPALTTYLINHIHSYSHIVTLWVLGPAILISVRLLRPDASGAPASGWLHALGGALWGLCYLCRSELLLFFGAHVGAVLYFNRRKLPLRNLAVGLMTFLLFFISYNFYADRAARRDGILIRHPIYSMYISQGWADPPPNVGGDIEGDGYLYAIKLYGDPVANGESLLTAIRKNPTAFGRRLRLNAQAFYAHYVDRAFFPPAWGLAALLLGAVALVGRPPVRNRLCIGFLAALFLASHFVLILHIDPRYLTINLPPLILLTAGGLAYLIEWLRRLPLPACAVTIPALVIGLGYGSLDQFQQLVHHRARNTQSVAAMRSLGEHFRTVVTLPRLQKNREPHVRLVFPERSPISPEDEFLLPYFAHTAYVNGGADGPFPRGKFYSYRDCADDYQYVPAEKIAVTRASGRGHVIADYENPVLGRYYLVQMNP